MPKLVNGKDIGCLISPDDMLVFGYVHSGFEPLFESLSESVRNVDVFIMSILRYRDEDIFHLDRIAETFNGRFLVAQISPQFANVAKKDKVDILPLTFSQIPGYLNWAAKSRKIWLFCEVSPPDEKGFCNTGYSAPFPVSLYDSCEPIGLINEMMPATYGDTAIPVSRFKYFVKLPEKLPLYPGARMTETMQKVGANVAELIEDGATVELGVGSVMLAVLYALTTKKGLSIQGGNLPEGVQELVEKNIVTEKCTANVTEARSPGLYDWLELNPMVEIRTMEHTHDILLKSREPKFTSIASAIYVDLLGQVVSETIGQQQVTGIGGALDFARASCMSNGKSIIAMLSVYGNNEASKIVPGLDKGNVVSMTRYDVDYVVTEYGIAELRYKTRREKALNLINVAHPKHREWLRRSAATLELI